MHVRKPIESLYDDAELVKWSYGWQFILFPEFEVFLTTPRGDVDDPRSLFLAHILP